MTEQQKAAAKKERALKKVIMGRSGRYDKGAEESFRFQRQPALILNLAAGCRAYFRELAEKPCCG